jgi:hypothetical protein
MGIMEKDFKEMVKEYWELKAREEEIKHRLKMAKRDITTYCQDRNLDEFITVSLNHRKLHNLIYPTD